MKQLPAGFRESRPQIKWRLIAGMRGKLVDEYFGVDHDIVWDAAENKVPEFASVLRPENKINDPKI